MPSSPVRGSGPSPDGEVHPRAEGFGRDDGQAQLVGERGDRAAAGRERLRAGVEPQAGDGVPADGPAGLVALLEHERAQALRGQASRAATSPATPPPTTIASQPVARRQSPWTSSTTRVSTVGSVSGGTP